jgi:hypothetical protein
MTVHLILLDLIILTILGNEYKSWSPIIQKMQGSLNNFNGREGKLGRGSWMVARHQNRLADWPSVANSTHQLTHNVKWKFLWGDRREVLFLSCILEILARNGGKTKGNITLHFSVHVFIRNCHRITCGTPGRDCGSKRRIIPSSHSIRRKARQSVSSTVRRK